MSGDETAERSAIEQALEQCVRRGWMEHAGIDNQGEQLYRLTVEGREAFEAGFETARLIEALEADDGGTEG